MDKNSSTIRRRFVDDFFYFVEFFCALPRNPARSSTNREANRRQIVDKSSTSRRRIFVRFVSMRSRSVVSGLGWVFLIATSENIIIEVSRTSCCFSFTPISHSRQEQAFFQVIIIFLKNAQIILLFFKIFDWWCDVT